MTTMTMTNSAKETKPKASMLSALTGLIESFLSYTRYATGSELIRRFSHYTKTEVENAIDFLWRKQTIDIFQVTSGGEHVWALSQACSTPVVAPKVKKVVRPAKPPKTSKAACQKLSNLSVNINDSQYALIHEFAQERGTSVEAAATYLLSKSLDLLLLANNYKT